MPHQKQKVMDTWYHYDCHFMRLSLSTIWPPSGLLEFQHIDYTWAQLEYQTKLTCRNAHNGHPDMENTIFLIWVSNKIKCRNAESQEMYTLTWHQFPNWASNKIKSQKCTLKGVDTLTLEHRFPNLRIKPNQIAQILIDKKWTPLACKQLLHGCDLKEDWINLLWPLQVQVENDILLKITGERKPYAFPLDQDVRDVLVERIAGKFMRKFNLPANANLDNITAACQDGQLTIIVPKNPPPDIHRPRTFAVPVSSANLKTEP